MTNDKIDLRLINYYMCKWPLNWQIYNKYKRKSRKKRKYRNLLFFVCSIEGYHRIVTVILGVNMQGRGQFFRVSIFYTG